MPTGEAIEREFGIPIVNKRISVTPMSMVAESCETEDYVPFAVAMDKAAAECGVNLIGGFSALVHKGMTIGDQRLIQSIPRALAETDNVCSSVNVATTRAGINMDAVALMGKIVTADRRAFSRGRGQGLREAGGIRQCGGGQPVYGGRIPWCGRA